VRISLLVSTSQHNGGLTYMSKKFDFFQEVTQENVLEGIFEDLNDGLMVLDDAGIILHGNGAAKEIFKAGSNPLTGYQFGIPAINNTTELTIPAPNSTRTIELKSREIPLMDKIGYVIIVRILSNNSRNY